MRLRSCKGLLGHGFFFARDGAAVNGVGDGGKEEYFFDENALLIVKPAGSTSH